MFKISNITKINEKRFRLIQILVVTITLLCCLSSLFASRPSAIDFITGEEVYMPRLTFAPDLNITQPDGVELTFRGAIWIDYGYTDYEYQSYTVILDTLTGYWCYAQRAEDGWLESTGYPVHLHDAEELGLRETILPSRERLNELKENYENDDAQTRKFETPWIKMRSTGEIKSLVIYVILADQDPATSFVDNDYYKETNYPNNPSSGSIQRYFHNMSNGNLNLSANLVTYQDTRNINYFRPFRFWSNWIGYRNDDQLKERRSELMLRALRGVQAQNPSLNFSVDDVNGRYYADNVVIILNREIIDTFSSYFVSTADIDVPLAMIHNAIRINNYIMTSEWEFIASNGGSVGILCHEIGHALGLDDMKNYATPNIDPIGKWDLMGDWTNPPQSLSAYTKYTYFPGYALRRLYHNLYPFRDYLLVAKE